MAVLKGRLAVYAPKLTPTSADAAFIPAIRGGASHTVSYYSHLGDSWGEIVLNCISRPAMTFRQFFPSDPAQAAKYEFYKVMPFCAGFLCLLSPLLLLVTLPSLAICMLSGRPDMWSPVFHYQAPMVPVIFVATVFVVRRWRALWVRICSGCWSSRSRAGSLIWAG